LAAADMNRNITSMTPTQAIACAIASAPKFFDADRTRRTAGMTWA
jgi:hypothetical protein